MSFNFGQISSTGNNFCFASNTQPNQNAFGAFGQTPQQPTTQNMTGSAFSGFGQQPLSTGFNLGLNTGNAATLTAQSTGFNLNPTTNTSTFGSNLSSFGSQAPANSLFGFPATTTSSNFSFGNSLSTQPSTGISFSIPTTTTAPSMFAAPATSDYSTAGTIGTSTNSFTSGFGTNTFKTSTSQPVTSFNLNFGTNQTTSASPFNLSTTTVTPSKPNNNFGSQLLNQTSKPFSLNLNSNNIASTTMTTSNTNPITTTTSINNTLNKFTNATTLPPLTTFTPTTNSTSNNFNTTSLSSLAPSATTTTITTISTSSTSKPSGFMLNFTQSSTTPSTLSSSIAIASTALTKTVASTSQSLVSTTSQSTMGTTQQPAAITQMTFKQLEGYINVWLNELNQMESDFQTQSQTINSWDSLLVNNGVKITNVNETLDMLKEEHKRIDQQLDFVISQQNELEQLLEPLEKIQVDFNVTDTATTEREFTYSLVETVSNDLQAIGSELQNFIKKLNETKANQDTNDPLSSIGKILNSHMDALQYIEHQIGVLKRNCES